MMFFFFMFCLCCACFVIPSVCFLVDGVIHYAKSKCFDSGAFLEMIVGLGGLLVGLGMFFANYSNFFPNIS